MFVMLFLVTHGRIFTGAVMVFLCVELGRVLGNGALFVIHEQRALVGQFLLVLGLKGVLTQVVLGAH